MMIHEKLSNRIPIWRERVKKLLTDHGDKVIDQITIGQVYGGMRDIKSLVTDISYVDPEKGILFRGLSIPEVLQKLPKPDGAEMPYIGGLYYLLLIGEIPTKAESKEVETEWAKRAVVPTYVFDVMRAMPKNTHPMTLLSQAVLALQNESEFHKGYHNSLKKSAYWMPTLEDALNLTSKLPVIAAYIHRLKHGNSYEEPKYDPNEDFGVNFARMLNVEDEQGYAELTRLYLLIHSDHESGNASAHATYLVGSTLADAYYAFSAGLNGLAGPLHGLANQESLIWLLHVSEKFGGLPSRNDLYQYAWETLKNGKVIPGYGHAVLRITDPRFTALLQYAKQHFPDNTLVKLVELVYDVVPQVLQEQGKAKDPAPNLDAISGMLQYCYGVKELDFYTVLFGIGRALGVTANLVWARALGQPLERPKSLTTAMLEEASQKD